MSKDKDQTGLKMKYFVLNPNKKTPYGRASRMALEAYAKEIGRTNRHLSEDILSWLREVCTELHLWR